MGTDVGIGEVVKVSEVLTWPQALVGSLLVIIVLGLPQIMNYFNNKTVRKQVTNNGGSSMKDAVDRIEKGQAEHGILLEGHLNEATERIKRDIEEKRIVDDRLVRLETLFEYAVIKKGDDIGTGSSGT